MHEKAVPPQFDLIKREGKTLILRKSLAEDLLRLGAENPWEWAKAAGASVEFYAGRAPAAAVTLPVAGGLRVVVRRYHHGGLLRRLQKDLYLFSFPPLREMAASQYAQQQGIPVAEILGAVQQRVGKMFYRVDLLMRHLPEGCDLGVYFDERYAAPQWKEKKEIVRSAAKLIRRMHDAGLFHADLHLKNIFMSEQGGKRNFYLLDFDKAHIIPQLTPEQRRKNLLRFYRYLEKYFGGKKIFTQTDRIEFLESYFGNVAEAEDFARQHGKMFDRHVRQHRLLWGKKYFTLHWWTYLFMRGLVAFLNLFPEKMAYFGGRVIARFAYWLDRKHRRRAVDNLKIAFGDSLPEKELYRITRQHRRNLSYLAVEFLRSLKMNEKELDAFYARQEVQGLENLKEGVRRGKGVLMLISHFGNWEIMSLIARDIGLPLDALAKPIKNKWVNQWVNRVRHRLGIQVIKASRLNRAILKALAQNHAVAMLIDQNSGRRGELIPFFGRPAPTSTAPAFFALKSGAAVIAAYAIRQKPGYFKIVIEPPLELIKKKDFREAVTANTELFSRNLEKMVRAYPEQWWWMHNRWKVRAKK